MVFSATGNLLRGSIERPDMTSFIWIEEKMGKQIWREKSFSCKLNRLGYIPGISTITGLGRALLGTVHTIVHLAYAIFGELQYNKAHLQEAILGMKNIGRGLIEAVPVIGNITMKVVDISRVNQFNKMASQEIEKINNYHQYIFECSYGEIVKQYGSQQFCVHILEKTYF